MLPSYATAITYSCKSFLVQATGVFNGKSLKEICVFLLEHGCRNFNCFSGISEIADFLRPKQLERFLQI
jgi:hypothetical protein